MVEKRCGGMFVFLVPVCLLSVAAVSVDQDDFEEALRTPVNIPLDVGGMEQLPGGGLTTAQQVSLLSSCGIPWKEYFNGHNVTSSDLLARPKRVVGNRDTAVSVIKYPWMAQVYVRKLATGISQFLCGASLIAPKVLLTAAHCLTRVPDGYVLYFVMLGVSEHGAFEQCEPIQECNNASRGVIRIIDRIEVHPSFTEGNLENAYTRPICLPLTDQLLKGWANGELVVPGWGATASIVSEETTTSKLLRQVTVFVRQRVHCDRFFTLDYGVLRKNRFCVLGVSGNSPCSGDSGGPYIKSLPTPVLNNANRWFQFGIVSAGGKHPETCGAQGRPSIATNVIYFVHWILDRIQNVDEAGRHKGPVSKAGHELESPELFNVQDISELEHVSDFNRINLTVEMGSGRDMNVVHHPNAKILTGFNECGQMPVVYTSQKRRKKRVIGGTDSGVEGYFPWMAQIYYSSDADTLDHFSCSGVIISKRHILSSATCVSALPSPYSLGKIIVGQYNRSSPFECLSPTQCFYPVNVRAEKVAVHPGYEMHVQNHDIAVLTLSQDLIFNEMVRAICLPRKESFIQDIKINRFTSAGWGKSHWNGSLSTVLKRVDIGLVARSQCNQVYIRDMDRTLGNRLCGGGKPHRGECYYDMGGPLMKRFSQNQDSARLANLTFLAGISIYTECGNPGMPTLYSNIMFYLHWILDQLGDEVHVDESTHTVPARR